MAKREHIKDLVYEKYFVINFRHGSLHFVYCKPEKFTFVALELIRHSDVAKLNVVKFKTKDEARSTLATIPMFEYNNEEVLLEITENTYLCELL